MKFLFPINKDTISLMSVAIITVSFFVAGILDVLDYFVFKVLIMSGVGILVIITSVLLFKSSLKNNRPEDKTQND